jgi:enoyl-CoA hydratase/carnithine racemase
MCEWLKQAVLKTAVPERVPGVRIPLPPPRSLKCRELPTPLTRVIKRQVYEAVFQALAEAFDISVREMMACFRTEDFKEGVAHFVEKRPAAFTGK